ncbi:kinase-like domain-containing protein [Aspergillus crustosus]
MGLSGKPDAKNAHQPDNSRPSLSLATSPRPSLITEGSTLTPLDEGDGLIYTALRRLQEGLKAGRVPCSVGQPQEFIPLPTLQRLVEENVEALLREESIVEADSIPEVAKSIVEEAPKLLATLIDSRKEKLVLPLLQEGITDDDLPFIKPRNKGIFLSLLTKNGRSIRTLKDWDSQSIDTFWKKQYRVLSPIFRQGEHYELDVLHPLPFIEIDTKPDYEPSAAGGYGKVTQRYIHPDHHELGDPRARDGLPVAVKRMFHESDYKAEQKVYEELGSSSHPNLINLLFTYRKDDENHLVFPWANGSLKDYWEKCPNPCLSSKDLIWALQQMVGLASGLAFFHDFINPTTGKPRFGRHGDIKAQNILFFAEENVMKIADLGLAKIHGRDSRSNVPPHTVIVSPTYSPPEAARKYPVSRKWDIWSIGCLYLEMMTHLILGSNAIGEFSMQRRESSDGDLPELTTDTFYSCNCSIKTSVESWVECLKRDPRCSTMMHNVLDLVMSRMIVIEPAYRSSAQEICDKLGRILERSQTDEVYLLKPNPLAASTPYRLPGTTPSLGSKELLLYTKTTPLIVGAPKSHSWNY